MKIPEDMRAELQAWNNGAGISLDTWIACEGNLKLAIGYSTVFWPSFALVDDYIVRATIPPKSIVAFERSCDGDRRAVEAVLNHLHVADIQAHSNPESTVERVRFLMPILKEIYEAKLLWQFPDRPCVVSLIHPADEDDVIGYQITFWQKKHEIAEPGATANPDDAQRLREDH